MTSSTVPKLRGVRLLPGLMAIALICLLLAAALLFFAPQSSESVAGSPATAGRLAVLSQSLPLKAQAAVHGNSKAFDALSKGRKELDATLKSVAAADPATAGDERWKKLLDAADKVLDGREPAEVVGKSAAEARELMPKLLAEIGNLSGVVGGNKIDAIGRQLERFELNGQRLQQDLDALAVGVGDPTSTAQRIADSADFLGQVLGGFAGEDGSLGLPKVTGAEGEQRLKSAQGLYSQLNERAREAVSATQALTAAQAAAGDMATTAEALAGLTPAVRAVAGQTGPNLLGSMIPLILIGIAVLALIALGVIYLSLANIRRAAEMHAKQNERNQEAILRLLDELSSLADGDLTVQATVTEDITGAIADSINYAIEALRELVTTINDSAIHLDGAARQTQALSAHLTKAAGAQAKQIASATESSSAMAASTEEVSGNAERASDVARHSVDVAHKGGDAVRRTIDGMNAIRETIQETSKRIKRLGESSQEIGNIVELINDIAEQTNILALNASIQASMAGEAGRGFAVVADEVQRLAERAANATKQIEVLVRTIQTDTNEAVVSMERSTTDVVGGALLAENAGAALEEIEQVSNQIASLVQNISASARGQSSAAGNVSRNMQVLREISSQTSESTSATSQSISKLAELSAQLRKSVAGFRLPNYTPPPAANVTPVAKASGPRPAPDSSPTGTMRKVSAGA
ncbi:MAG TPA: methyl-accepting chemotaxis protein [Steroidobacteraceae bacterium]|jgi:twitching motility protein PilJ|nr:methyl-accepting chemotaxis protein [Steroidobacteraceae bacterium]